MKTKKIITPIVLMTISMLLISGCDKTNGLDGPVFEAEGYIIGYHPCVANATVQTSHGEGKGYLVATTDAEPDTLMVYRVPVGLFDIPDEWFRHSATYLLPEEGRSRFKMRFSYRRSSEDINIGSQYPCNAMWPQPNYPVHLMNPEYSIIKAERIE